MMTKKDLEVPISENTVQSNKFMSAISERSTETAGSELNVVNLFDHKALNKVLKSIQKNFYRVNQRIDKVVKDGEMYRKNV